MQASTWDINDNTPVSHSLPRVSNFMSSATFELGSNIHGRYPTLIYRSHVLGTMIIKELPSTDLGAFVCRYVVLRADWRRDSRIVYPIESLQMDSLEQISVVRGTSSPRKTYYGKSGEILGIFQRLVRQEAGQMHTFIHPIGIRAFSLNSALLFQTDNPLVRD